MGEQTDGKLYFSVNGVDYTDLIGLPTVTTEEVEATERRLSLDGGCFTARIKMPKVIRCKSRKRFKKLLMSIGVPRNVAQNIRVQAGESYAAAWWTAVMMNLCSFK